MTQIDLTAPLSGVTVLDMTTALGEYAGRLLADLGADVLRFDVEGATDPYRRAFMNAGKQMRASQPSGTELAELLARAQVLLTSEGPAALRPRAPRAGSSNLKSSRSRASESIFAIITRWSWLT